MNRSEKRQITKQIEQSKMAIINHLNFLNAVGSPQYELKKISPLKAMWKRLLKTR